MNQEAVGEITRNPLWVQMLIFSRAAVVEEILYRGYPLERVQELTGYRSLALAVSVVVFVLGHVAYWGGAQLIVAAFGAGILALLYLWRRDLICNMIAHFLVDLVGFLAAGRPWGGCAGFRLGPSNNRPAPTRRFFKTNRVVSVPPRSMYTHFFATLCSPLPS